MAREGPPGPNIRYARTRDGIAIAYWTLGSGEPLLHLPPFPMGHLLVEWQNSATRDYLGKLSDGRLLVRYDGRGSGLSDREVTDYSQEARLRDIEAVADSMKLERFALLGFGHSGPAAAAYAALNPERVSRLVLWHSYARTSDITSLARIQAARSLIQRDWNVYAELEGYRVSGWAGGAAARWYAEYVKASITPEGLVASFDSIGSVDLTALLPLIKAPTLVIARRNSEVLPVEVAERLVKAIPDARLAFVPGTGVIPFPDVVDEFIRAVRDFLAGSGAGAGALTPRETEVLRLIAAGKSNTEIGSELSLSVRTVARHVTNIYGKIGAQNRSEATSHAIRNRIA